MSNCVRLGFAGAQVIFFSRRYSREHAIYVRDHRKQIIFVKSRRRVITAAMGFFLFFLRETEIRAHFLHQLLRICSSREQHRRNGLGKNDL